jgi:hypothetical protein
VKVPKREVMFLLDQRRSRKMKIEGVDPKVTGLWDRTEEREAGSSMMNLPTRRHSRCLLCLMSMIMWISSNQKKLKMKIIILMKT